MAIIHPFFEPKNDQWKGSQRGTQSRTRSWSTKFVGKNHRLTIWFRNVGRYRLFFKTKIER